MKSHLWLIIVAIAVSFILVLSFIALHIDSQRRYNITIRNINGDIMTYKNVSGLHHDDNLISFLNVDDKVVRVYYFNSDIIEIHEQ